MVSLASITGISLDGCVECFCAESFGRSVKNVALVVGRFRLLIFLVNDAIVRANASSSRSCKADIERIVERAGLQRFIQRNRRILLGHSYPLHTVCSLPQVTVEIVKIALEAFRSDTHGSVDVSLRATNVPLGPWNVTVDDIIRSLDNVTRMREVLCEYTSMPPTAAPGHESSEEKQFRTWALMRAEIAFVSGREGLQEAAARNLGFGGCSELIDEESRTCAFDAKNKRKETNERAMRNEN